MLKIFNCFEDVRLRFKVRCVNRFLLLSVLWLWLIVPGIVSAQVPVPPVEVPVEVVDIPDQGLRAAIAEKLGKAPGDAITRADMETLGELRAGFREITDLRGIEFAINLTRLYLWFNGITDISPLSSLTNLTRLNLEENNISDISPLSNLTNLTELVLWFNSISDISALSNLTNLTELVLKGNTITDLSPLSSLTNLTRLVLGNNGITDISALSSLTNLTDLGLDHNSISDLSALSSLTNLTALFLRINTITDLSPLASLTNLTDLDLGNNAITDLSPLSSLTNLTWLDLERNNISDIFALIALTNLTRLHLEHNTISDIETLESLMAQGTVVFFRGNPAFETPGPKIEDGWVGLIVPAMDVHNGSDAAGSGRDFLSEASGGTVTEIDVARNGARAGTQVGDSVWTPGRLDATDPDNLNTIVGYAGLTDIRYPVVYGVVSIRSETLQETRLYIGAGPVKVWLNGALVYRDTHQWSRDDYETALPVLLTPGENVLFVAAYRLYPWIWRWGAFFGFQDSTVYTVGAPGPDPLDVNGNGQVNVLDLVLVAAAYGTRATGHPADVNADGIVNIQDLIAVAAGIDASGAALPQAVKDALVAAAAEVEAIEAIAEAPKSFNTAEQGGAAGIVYHNVAAALADVKHLATSDAHLGKFVPLLEELLQILAEMRAIPETTALLPNYPNPFNPETWIPYQLSESADVTLHIHAVNSTLVRTLSLGHQPAGIYRSRNRAAYWDGKNASGESVASGVYFYTLTAGEFTATRKLLIRK